MVIDGEIMLVTVLHAQKQQHLFTKGSFEGSLMLSGLEACSYCITIRLESSTAEDSLVARSMLTFLPMSDLCVVSPRNLDDLSTAETLLTPYFFVGI